MFGHAESMGFPVGIPVPEGPLMVPSMAQLGTHPMPAGMSSMFPGQPPVSEAVSSQLLPSPEVPADVAQLLVKGRDSWLKGNELVQLLEHGIAGKFPLSAAAADMPHSGTLFLYDRKKVRFFRLDGHNWRKKHDGKTVRETHEKLKVDNVDKLNCYYAHALEPFNLQRRCYWLLENDKFVLVHYLEAGFGTKRAANRWNELLQQQPEMSLMSETDSQGRPLMPAPGASAGMVQRRRCSLDSSKMSEGSQAVGYPAGGRGRASFEDTSRRHSSMEESRDTYLVPPNAWQPHQQMARLSPWAPSGQLCALTPWQQTEPQSSYQQVFPWSVVPHSAAALQMPKLPEHSQHIHQQAHEFLSFHQAAPTANEPRNNQSSMDVDSRHNSGSAHTVPTSRPSLDDSAISNPASAPVFSICEISPQVVSIHGGDKVLIVGNGCELSSGIYIEVDGERCPCQVVHGGVISFFTRAHAKGLTRIVIFNEAGQVISSSAALEFAEPMLPGVSMPPMPSPPANQPSTHS